MSRRQPTSASELQRIATIYDSAAPRWLERIGKGETLMLGDTWRDGLVEHLRGNTLEIGIGAGDTLLRMANQPHNVTHYTGIDLSMGMVAEAQKAAANVNVPTQLLQANAESMPMFGDGIFDTVTASLVFCTIPRPEDALAEIARVCKPCGRVVLIEHVLAPNRPVRLLQKLVAPAQSRKYGCHVDRRTDAMLQDLGFSIEHDESRWFGVFRFIIASPPGCPPKSRAY